MIKRILIRSLLIIALLLATLLSAVMIVVGTSPGSRWLIMRVAPVVGAEVGDVEGTLMRNLTLIDVGYQLGEQRYSAHRVQLAWRPVALMFGMVSVSRLEADALLIDIPLSDDAPEDDTAPTWPSLASPLPIEIDKLQINGLDVRVGESRYQIDRISSGVTYGLFRARLNELYVGTAASEVTLDATLALSYPYALEGELAWVLAAATDTDMPFDVTRLVPEILLDPELAGRLRINGDVRELALNLALRAPESITAELNWVTGLSKQAAEPQLTGTIEIPGLSPSRFSDAELLVGSEVAGTINIDGWLDGYQVSADLVGQLPDYPTLTLDTRLQGDLQGISVEQAQVEAAGAELELSGTLDWQTGLTWNVALAATGINPAEFAPQWPGNLRLKAASQGSLQDNQLELTVGLEHLRGQLRGLAVNARAQIATTDGHWTLEDGYLAVGGNRINLTGFWADSYALNWDLAAPFLGEIDPMLGGTIDSDGELTGSADTLSLAFNAQTDYLKVGDFLVRGLDLSTQEQTLTTGQLQLAIAELTLPGATLKNIELAMNGGPSSHEVNLSLEQEGNTLALAFAGEYQDMAWQGDITHLRITNGYTRPMQLRQAVALSLSPTHLDMGFLCLVDTTASDQAGQTHICTSARWQAGDSAAGVININRLPLALAQNWLGADVNLAGYIKGSGQWQQAPGEDVELTFNAEAVDGALLYQFGDEETDTYTLDDLTLSVDLAEQQLSARAETRIDNYGSVLATLSANLDTRQFESEALFNWRDLSPLEALAPGVHNLRGNIDAKLNAGGDFANPALTVNATLADTSFHLPALGTQFTDISGSLSGDQNELGLNLAVTAGEGSIALDATARDLIDAWQFEARLTGDAAQMMATSMLNLKVTPDLTVSGRAGEIRVRGTADVPYARAIIKTLPVSATRVSDDVIVIDGDEVRGNGNGLAIYSNVELRLGDNVTLNAAGLEARLGGSLRLNREPGRPMYTLGQINIVRGRFESYGQDLTIERGVLAFTGPMDNPGLDITATRETEDYTAGIIIGGTLQNPTSEVFARPAVSQSDAMAILFTGKPMSQTSSSDQSMLVTAVANYGLNKSGSFIGGFGDDLGLDEFTIKTGDQVEDSQLWLGKYLTPKLYVYYAVSLFEQVNNVGITYFINDNFRVEAESGEHQSADVIFKMER